jgi:hypothetical protein
MPRQCVTYAALWCAGLEAYQDGGFMKKIISVVAMSLLIVGLAATLISNTTNGACVPRDLCVDEG